MEVAEGVRRMEKKVDGEEAGFWEKKLNSHSRSQDPPSVIAMAARTERLRSASVVIESQ